MKKIIYEIFEKEAEILSFTDGGGHYADIIFKNVTDGYFTVGSEAYKISEGKITLNINSLPDGEITPILTANGAFISLPTLFKDGTLLCPAEIDDGYIREISLRGKRAEELLKRLSEKVAALEKSVYGTKLF